MTTSFRPTRRLFLATGLTALAAPALGRSAPVVEVLDGRAFGSHWRVTLPAGRNAGRHRPAIEALLADIDAQMSPWQPDSAVSAFNAAPRGEHPAPADLAGVTATALAIAAESGGWFDPTVGPLVAHWGFGPIRGSERPDWRGLSAGEGHLAKAEAGLTLDLCGIVKGFALDRVVALLEAAGERDLLADLGGELAARGRHPSGRGWSVAVEEARRGLPGGAAALLRLDSAAVATSGLAAQRYEIGGQRVGHIIDPRARAPQAGRLASVTVAAADATRADAWATALFAAGEVEGPALATRAGLDALFLIDGEAVSVTTGSIAARLV
ncbi:FAD:protein FMN transferase [Paracoccus sp. S-4012]|uniref:FAD:protein FMN transferase n=1 Tax=Paracoccus sp. S-4012 TaxID=2665648 RepID=UPI0012B05E81|nr:FAD:protein FMN transferase [Paracoccus sp. S-4012]MRX49479.1 FAD:protein FMN transferase [Paracoccus sp. S-4012]